MANPWFRMYAEAVDDDKLRLLAFEDRWHFVAILCLKTQGTLENLEHLDRRVAVKLGLGLREADEVRRRLIEVGLVDENWQPVKWDERQYKSDTSKERTRAYRDRMKRHRDVTVTVQETDTDTDTEERKPLSALQAKHDPANRLNGKTQMVEQVMGYLNLQARRNYRTKNPNGTPTAGAMVIAQRLKEGYTVDQCKDVIGIKSNAWMGDEKMDQYLNPQTLFRKSNFDKYLTEAEAQQ